MSEIHCKTVNYIALHQAANNNFLLDHANLKHAIFLFVEEKVIQLLFHSIALYSLQVHRASPNEHGPAERLRRPHAGGVEDAAKVAATPQARRRGGHPLQSTPEARPSPTVAKTAGRQRAVAAFLRGA